MTDYTYNTGNPIGSTDVRDGVDNLKSFDILLNSTDDTYQDRLGNTVPTAAGAIKRLGPVVMSWTFTTGGTLNYPNEAALNPADGNYYSWGGTHPNVVAPGTDPTLPGSGYAPRTDVVLRDQLAYRSFNSIQEMKDLAAIGDKCIIGMTMFYRSSSSSVLLGGFSATSPCYFSDFNGICDGVTPNDTVLAEIMSLSNYDKHIVFDAKEKITNLGYKFSSNPDLTNAALSSENGGFIICPVSIGNASHIIFNTSLRVILTAYNADFEYPKNSGLDVTPINIGPACVAPNLELSEAVNLTDGSVRVMAIDGYNTPYAFTGYVVDDQMAWGSKASHDEGFMSETSVGWVHECCFIWNGASTDGAVISTILTTDYRYLIRLNPNLRAINIVKVDRTGSYQPVYDGLTNDLTNNYVITPNGGCIVVSVRITSSTAVEIYLNECLFKKLDLSELIQQVGFFVSASGTGPSSDIQIYKPMVVKNKIPKGGRAIKIACVGDSITYGAESAITWPEMLKMSAKSYLGIGGVDVDNLGVGGMTWAYFATGAGSLIDYSEYDYALIMLGTNDVQAATPIGAVGSQVDILLDKIISEGCIPIVGLFPVWTEYQFSGNGNSSAKNTRFAPKYRAEIKSRAIKKGVVIANPLSYVGNNTQWMHDNIHPRSEGQVAIAAAFSSALGGVAGPSTMTNDVIKRLVEPIYGFDPSVEFMTVVNDKGVVSISGAALRRQNEPLLATIPVGYRPARKIMAVGSDITGNVIPLSIEPDGRVMATSGVDTTISVNAGWTSPLTSF